MFNWLCFGLNSFSGANNYQRIRPDTPCSRCVKVQRSYPTLIPLPRYRANRQFIRHDTIWVSRAILSRYATPNPFRLKPEFVPDAASRTYTFHYLAAKFSGVVISFAVIRFSLFICERRNAVICVDPIIFVAAFFLSAYFRHGAF